MKLYLFMVAMMLAMATSSQEMPDGYAKDRPYVHTKVSYIDNDGKIIICDEMSWARMFASLLKEYEEECIADSFLTEKHLTKGDMYCITVSTGFDSRCISEGHVDTMVWAHREADFEGFKKFIINKAIEEEQYDSFN